METCNRCGIYQGHALSCPTRLVTKEQRVELAAHLFQCFVASADNHIVVRSCQCAGLTEQEINEGRSLAVQERAAKDAKIAWLGSPAYGGWR